MHKTIEKKIKQGLLEAYRATVRHLGMSVLYSGCILVTTSCDRLFRISTQELTNRSDYIVLARVETNSGYVVNRYDRLIISKLSSPISIASNSILPGLHEQLAPGYSYGDQAIVFLSQDPSGRFLKLEGIAPFYDGFYVDEGGRHKLSQVIDEITKAAGTTPHK
jgi:hypothetical protein